MRVRMRMKSRNDGKLCSICGREGGREGKGDEEEDKSRRGRRRIRKRMVRRSCVICSNR